MATAKIWHYTGNRGDEGNTKTDLQKEPYVSRQQVTTSVTAAASTASPAGTNLCRIEVTTATRYLVRLSGDTTAADVNDPLLGTTAQVQSYNWIHLQPGATVSLIEAV